MVVATTAVVTAVLVPPAAPAIAAMGTEAAGASVAAATTAGIAAGTATGATAASVGAVAGGAAAGGAVTGKERCCRIYYVSKVLLLGDLQLLPLLVQDSLVVLLPLQERLRWESCLDPLAGWSSELMRMG